MIRESESKGDKTLAKKLSPCRPQISSFMKISQSSETRIRGSDTMQSEESETFSTER
jgi:hypothetical protein